MRMSPKAKRSRVLIRNQRVRGSFAIARGVRNQRVRGSSAVARDARSPEFQP